jgi:hypothetical protein
MPRSQRDRFLGRIVGFLDRCHYFFFQVAQRKRKIGAPCFHKRGPARYVTCSEGKVVTVLN